MANPTTKRTKPARTTVDLCAYVRPEVRQRAIEEAARQGLLVSEYVAALIRAEAPPVRAASGLRDLGLAAHRVVVALDEARARGETGSVECLTALRAEIVHAWQILRPEYDALADQKREDDWSGH